MTPGIVGDPITRVLQPQLSESFSANLMLHFATPGGLPVKIQPVPSRCAPCGPKTAIYFEQRNPRSCSLTSGQAMIKLLSAPGLVELGSRPVPSRPVERLAVARSSKFPSRQRARAVRFLRMHSLNTSGSSSTLASWTDSTRLFQRKKYTYTTISNSLVRSKYLRLA